MSFYKTMAAATAALLLTTSLSSAADVVRLGNLKFAHYGAISYMKNMCKKYDLDVRERVFAKGIDIMPAIVAGEIDIAASAVDAAIAGRSQGVPIYAVAGFAEGGARIVAGNKTAIKSMADFKGKKVGVARGGAQELLLLAELDKHGLTWSDKPGRGDVQIIYMAFPDLNQAVMAGDIDGMSQSEPYASQAINKGFGVEVIKPYDTPLGMPVRSLVMSEKMYGNADVAQRVLDCFVEATDTFIKNPQLAEEFVIKDMFRGQITSQDFKDAIGNSPYTFHITTEHVQLTTDLMQKYGVGRMQKPPTASDWVKLDLLEKAEAKLSEKGKQ